MLNQVTKPVVTVDRVDNLPSRAGAHKAVWLTVEGLSPDNNRVEFDAGALGVRKARCLTVHPIDEPFSVAWNGDPVNIELVFDGWQDGVTRVMVEVWG